MLSITQLTKTYSNGVRALDGINLNIPKGMFGLLGPNGAGKSSLMRTIATLQAPDQGSIVFDGTDAPCGCSAWKGMAAFDAAAGAASKASAGCSSYTW